MTGQAGLALLLTDTRPSPTVAAALMLAGYEVDVVHSVDAAARVLKTRVPTLLLAGPFSREVTGLDFLILRHLELAARIIVVSDDPSLLAMAARLGVQVRTPSTEPVLDAPELELEAFARSLPRSSGT